MTNAVAIAAWALSAILVSELFGYPLHRLLHSGFIHFLSKNHMQHHLLLYSPLQKQRPSEEHLDATTGQVALGNISLEWIIPAGILLIVLAGVFCFLRVSPLYQFLSVGIVLAWTSWVFSYLHDRIRIKGFWMERAPILRHWFCWARRLHDIRQRALNDRGLMDQNFGIGFGFFDWLFGTMASVQTPFNHAGLEVAQQKFDSVTRGQCQLRAAAKGLTIKKRTGGSQ